jgi:hypothetical protein
MTMTSQQRPPGGPSSGWPLFVVVFLLCWPAVVTWLIVQAIMRATGWRWWYFTLGGLAVGGLYVAALGGPGPTLAAHFSGYVGLAAQLGKPTFHAPALGALLWPQLPLAVPLGAAAAGVNAAVRPAGPAELHPGRVKQAAKAGARQLRRSRKLAERAGQEQPRKLTAPPLAVSIDGDLDEWRQGRYVVPPSYIFGLPRAVIGQPGFGKSVELERETYLAGYAARRVTLFDAKGSDPTFTPGIVAAYLAGCRDGGHPEPRIGLFPEQAMDVWRGGPRAVANRFMAVWQFPGIAEFYGEAAQLALRLALEAPGEPCQSSAELVHRIQPGTLRHLWEGDPDRLELIKSVGDVLPGVAIRVGNLVSAMGGALDGGWSFEDVDLAVITVPTMVAPKDGDAILRVLLVDYGHYTLARKAPGWLDLLIFDEFSALAGGRDRAISLVERARGSGSGVILSAQSRQALGDEQEASRILHACSGGVVLFRTPEPDDMVRLAGTRRVADLVHQLQDGEATGRASATVRAQTRLDPNAVRAYGPGEAAIILGGRVEHIQVIRTTYAEELRAEAAALVDQRRLESTTDVPTLGTRPSPEELNP